MKQHCVYLFALLLLSACQDSSLAPLDAAAPAASLSGQFEGGTGTGFGLIEGLYYRGAGYGGHTDSLGQYRYRPGETLRFIVDDIELGSGPASERLSPYALAGGCGFSPALVRLARLLYSLDRDGEPGNGLQLPVVAAAPAPLPLASFSDAELEARVQKLVGSDRHLADSGVALDAFVRLLDGETWTQVGSDTFLLSTLFRSQGVSTDGSAWWFSWQDGLQRSNDQYLPQTQNSMAIPQALRDQGSDHIGDTDIDAGLLYAPIENAGYTNPLIALYDPQTLDYLGRAYSLNPHQAHVAWIAIDAPRRRAYSGDWDPMAEINVYDLDHEFQLLAKLPLSERLSRVQGGKVYQGALYLSRDDEAKSVYKINLDTGTVLRLFGLTPDGSGQLGEMEGLAFRDLGAGGLMHGIDIKASFTGANFRHHRLSEPPLRKRWCAAAG
jgi:hypothetical protein